MRISALNPKLIRDYVINLLILLLAFGGMLRRSFNADTVQHMMSPDFDVSFRMMHGRYLTGLCDFLLGQAGLRTTDHTGITVLVGLLLMALSVSFIQLMYRELLNLENFFEELVFLAATNLVFTNVLASELTMFSEFTAYFAASFALAAIGAWFFSRRRYVLFIICITASCLFYQTGIILCAILISFHIFLENKGRITKTVIFRQTGGLIGVIGIGLANIISVRILVRLVDDYYVIKTFNDNNLRENIAEVIRHSFDMFKGSLGLLPSYYLPLLFSLTMLIIFTWMMIRTKKYQTLFYSLLLQLCLFVLIYSISIMGGYTSPPPRMIFLFYLVQVTTGITAFHYSKGLTKKLVGYLFMAYLFLHIFFAQIIVTQHFVSNTLDKLYANMVYAKIVEYEEETGITVTKLAVGRDADSKHYYDEVSYTSHSVNERVIGIINWIVVEMVSGRSFERLLMDEAFLREHFGDKDWIYIDLSEQLIIEGDTAYWVIF